MRIDLTTLIIVSTGAAFYWILSGFKGTFNDYMSRYYDRDNKYDKNYWTGFALLAFMIMNILAMLASLLLAKGCVEQYVANIAIV